MRKSRYEQAQRSVFLSSGKRFKKYHKNHIEGVILRNGAVSVTCKIPYDEYQLKANYSKYDKLY